MCRVNFFPPLVPLIPPLQKTKKVDFGWNTLADQKFVFHDNSLVETVREGDPEAHAFFRLLALCHTVMPEEKKEGERHLMDNFITACQVAAKRKLQPSVALALHV